MHHPDGGGAGGGDKRSGSPARAAKPNLGMLDDLARDLS
jgi:hypothetical protein